MELLEQIALAALRRDSLLLRSLVQDWTCKVLRCPNYQGPYPQT